jgi:hypothetical protein
MIVRLTTIGLAAAILAVSSIGGAEAGERKKRKWRQIYEQAPEYVLRRPLSYIFGGGYSLTREEFAMLYGDDPDFDEDYYDPERDVQEPAVKKKTKPANTVVKPKAKPAVKTAAKPAEPTTTDLTAKSDAAVKTAAVSPKPETAAPSAKTDAPAAKAASGALSCDKAGQIISGYGFSGVKPSVCTGKVYAFDATRDGSSFAIKLDSSSGELTEVKKQ